MNLDRLLEKKATIEASVATGKLDADIGKSKLDLLAAQITKAKAKGTPKAPVKAKAAPKAKAKAKATRTRKAPQKATESVPNTPKNDTIEDLPVNTKKPAAVGYSNISSISVDDAIIPEKNKKYIRHPNFKKIEAIVKSGLYFPSFITGLSGNGKTLMIEQVCAHLKREFYRVNITIETDEDDLLGGFRLINGDTVWQNGPVIEAMLTGGVLLLDEIDLASNKIMCLQSVLEGNGVYLKKIAKWVKPAKGFTVFATANTKGKGDNSGGFVGTNVLNEAFLDRFKRTFYQGYPTKAVELRILNKVGEELDAHDEAFASTLVEWAAGIRKSYDDDAVDEVISTRRLVTIIESFSIFGDKREAIMGAIERFDDDTRDAFIDFYKALDDTFVTEEEEAEIEASNATNTEQEVKLDW